MNVLAREDFGLPVQGKVITIFTNQDMSQKAGTGAATLNRARGQRGLGEGLTACACHARADDPAHDKTTGNILQLLGDIFADLA